MFQTFPGVLAAVAPLSAGGIAAVLVDFDYTHNPTFQSDKQPQLTTKAVPFTPPVAIVLVVVVAALFACVACCICIRHRRRSNVSVADLHTAATQKCGLGREDIDAFPAFYYFEVKDRKIGMGALECAVCLIEFEDADKLTLLPKCDHVFHTECIGVWLEHHITCPVCRSDLTEAATDEITKNDESGFRQGEIALQLDEIQIADGETVGKQKAFDMSKFRSHTTGHSLVVSGENHDRFTLKLPTGVRKEVMKRSLMNRTRSSVSGKSGFNGESDRRSASFNQWFRWSMKSDRRAIFTRTISMFSPKAETDGGGGSSDFRGGGRATRRTKSLKMLNRQDVNEL